MRHAKIKEIFWEASVVVAMLIFLAMISGCANREKVEDNSNVLDDEMGVFTDVADEDKENEDDEGDGSEVEIDEGDVIVEINEYGIMETSGYEMKSGGYVRVVSSDDAVHILQMTLMEEKGQGWIGPRRIWDQALQPGEEVRVKIEGKGELRIVCLQTFCRSSILVE